MNQSELVFVPLGGVGEIGMNVGLYGLGPRHDRHWLMVDCGICFPGLNMPGIEVIYPDLSYVHEEVDNLHGIVVTHAHEDHYGALVELWPDLQVPVYMTPFASGLLSAKQLENKGREFIDIQEINPQQSFQVGPFQCEFLPVSHSIVEACALVLRAQDKLLVHTGDWKLDPAPGLSKPTDIASFETLGKEGVTALICDSTNATKSGMSLSERDVDAGLLQAIETCKGRVVVTLFASNVARIHSVARAAQACGRTVILAGRALHRTTDVAGELGYLDDIRNFQDVDTFDQLSRAQTLVICTGSQGEYRAALARIANQEHPQVKLTHGDTVIFSSRPIPGNEMGVQKIINQFIDQGVEVLTHHHGQLHVSGHPHKGELMAMYDALKPDILVPVHGEPMHLHEQARIARESGIKHVLECRNGDEITLAHEPSVQEGEYRHGRRLSDGNLLVDSDDLGLRERLKLSYAGVVTVYLVIYSNGKLADEPQLQCFGLPEYSEKDQGFDEFLYTRLLDFIDELPMPQRRDEDHLQESVRRMMRNTCYTVWGKRPLCHVFVSVIDT